MVRFVGVNIPTNKKIDIALTYIYGIGLHTSRKILKDSHVCSDIRVSKLSNDQVKSINEELKRYDTEGELRSRIAMDIKILREIKSYRGVRHYSLLPVRGQRTHTNAMTRRRGKKLPNNKKLK